MTLIFDTTYLIRVANTGYMINCVAANLGILKLRYSFHDHYPPDIPAQRGRESSWWREWEAPWGRMDKGTPRTDLAARICILLCYVWLFGLVGTLNQWWSVRLSYKAYHTAVIVFAVLMAVQLVVLALIPQRAVNHVNRTPWVSSEHCFATILVGIG